MRGREGGFTLIEVMITVVIIGILASIAYPSYTRYVQEARRTDGMAKLMEIAGRLERCYTAGDSYNAGSCPSGSIVSDKEYYNVSISTPSNGEYMLTAIPASDKPQAKDTQCAQLTISQKGVRGSKDSSGSDSDCW